MADVPVTQRAYTLRLRGVDKNDSSWRERLWKTHEAVNKGAQAFGDWLLTLRGGLDHTLVDMKVKTKNLERDPNDDEKRDRLILLALSWLSVESEKGAPSNYFVQNDLDTKSGKRSNWKTVDALKEILQSRGVNNGEVEQWVNDCSASLSAAIRDDAVWVNRSKAFDYAVKSIGDSLIRDEVWDMLDPFFGNKESYLKPLKTSEGGDEETADEEKAKDLVQKAGQWLSSRFGTGKGADFCRMADIYGKIAAWTDNAQEGTTGNEAINNLAAALSEFNPASKDLRGVLGLISGPGYKSATRNLLNQLAAKATVTQQDFESLKDKATSDAEKCKNNIGSKGQHPYSDAILKDVESVCGFTYLQDGGPARHSEFAVMLDHAGRRVSLAHTWIKRAEAERRRFEEDAQKISGVPQSAKDWLNKFCEERSGTSGAIEGYRIRKRAVDGWKEVVKAWSKTVCKTEEDRIAAARALQDDPEIDKFGDIQLFEALAVDEAKCVWHKEGDPNKEPDPQPLLNYVAATDAEAKKRRFKVPAYRHPDALLHPVFCDFGNSRWDIKFDIHEYKKNNKKAATVNIHGLKMRLLDGGNVTDTPLQWSSKLLTSDLALKQEDSGDAPDVSRASRLGRAVKNITKDAAVNIAGLFEQNDWNGRLQAPREQLEIIARLKKKSPDKAVSLRDKIKWLISFSPRLQQRGPWIDYAAKKFADDAPAEPFVSRTGDYAVKHKDNGSRKGHAKLILSRLPGLRVLSVDLGHRYAAACAVWEAITDEELKKACKEAGCNEPFNNAMYLHLKSKAQNGKDKTTIYRRIGPDTLSDNKAHPAPWARLDRQFLIKLQGEEKPARKASPDEIEAFCKLELELGRKALEDRSFQVDELMSDAVNTVRLALRRHADRARIAHYLITDEKTLPGGNTQQLDGNGRVELITDALELWHGLATSNQWEDKWAETLWNEQAWKDDVPLTKRDIEDKTRQQIKKDKEELRNKLKPIAKKLAKQDNMKLHTQWCTRYLQDDANWKKRLRWLRDWILPTGNKAKDKSIRNVGGLSLTRIATMKSLYQVQKAFYTRLKPDGSHETAGEGFGQSILDAMENMREQRVKQLASRIVEAALGVGRIKIPKKGKDPKRPCERVDTPCHAVVIENLTHYRPEETRTRRENRQLMTWSSSKVKKYLSEGCQLHGLHLREVQAGYTSRQDSRTGAPGIRCDDVPVKDFFESPFWKKETERAEKKQKENKDDARDKYLLALKERWSKESNSTCSIRIPRKGGEIFVSADKNSPASMGIQADLNAAANIGLKALLDPDWPGKWWYVPCDSKEFKPVKDKVSGSTAIDVSTPLKTASTEGASETAAETGKKKRGKRGDSKSKEVVNLWRDVSLTKGEWKVWKEYENQVQCRVIKILRKQSKLNA
jgi:IS605 OrfB family transposase